MQRSRESSLDGGDGVVVVDDVGLVRRGRDAGLSAGPASDGFIAPDLLDGGCVLHQAQQGGPGGHQRSAHLLLAQPVQAAIELSAVLIEEHLELDPGWLVDDVIGEGHRQGRHARSIARSFIISNQCTSAVLPTAHA